MRPNLKSAVYIWCAVLACCCLTSCGGPGHYTVTTKDIPILADNAHQKIPFRAGFFMDERFAKVTYSVEALRRPLYEPPVIEFDARAALEQAVRRMFTEVMPVAATETIRDFEAKNLDVLVSIGPMNCESHLSRDAVVSLRSRVPINIMVTMDWAVTSPDGRLVTSTKAIGEGQAQSGWNGEGCRDAFIVALNDHLKKAYGDIVMTSWWRDSSWKSK